MAKLLTFVTLSPALPHQGGGCSRFFSNLLVASFASVAGVAQLVEQPIRNRQVGGSSPLAGTIPNLSSKRLNGCECRGVIGFLCDLLDKLRVLDLVVAA